MKSKKPSVAVEDKYEEYSPFGAYDSVMRYVQPYERQQRRERRDPYGRDPKNTRSFSRNKKIIDRAGELSPSMITAVQEALEDPSWNRAKIDNKQWESCLHNTTDPYHAILSCVTRHNPAVSNAAVATLLIQVAYQQALAKAREQREMDVNEFIQIFQRFLDNSKLKLEDVTSSEQNEARIQRARRSSRGLKNYKPSFSGRGRGK